VPEPAAPVRSGGHSTAALGRTGRRAAPALHTAGKKTTSTAPRRPPHAVCARHFLDDFAKTRHTHHRHEHFQRERQEGSGVPVLGLRTFSTHGVTGPAAKRTSFLSQSCGADCTYLGLGGDRRWCSERRTDLAVTCGIRQIHAVSGSHQQEGLSSQGDKRSAGSFGPRTAGNAPLSEGSDRGWN